MLGSIDEHNRDDLKLNFYSCEAVPLILIVVEALDRFIASVLILQECHQFFVQHFKVTALELAITDVSVNEICFESFYLASALQVLIVVGFKEIAVVDGAWVILFDVVYLLGIRLLSHLQGVVMYVLFVFVEPFDGDEVASLALVGI